MGPERSIVVFGAGAVGGYLGGKLASAGASVTLVGRERLVDAVERNGLRIRESRGDEVSHPKVVISAANLPPASIVLLTIRAYDVMTSISDIGQLLAPDGCLIAMQNGVGTEEFIGSALGRARVI